MKHSLIVLGFFIFGVVLGLPRILPSWLSNGNVGLYVLYGLLVLVGIGIGGEGKAWQALKGVDWRLALVPIAITVGSLGGAALASLTLPGIGVREAVAVGSGMGYYSLSSVMIGQLRGESLGAVALLANLGREVLTLSAAPLLVRVLGGLAPIACAGATAMDTTLPIITRFAGKDYAIVSLFSGVVLSIAVPVLITLSLAW
jgi:uncharacterized membrane protein YbjE (DUF340 family)